MRRGSRSGEGDDRCIVAPVHRRWCIRTACNIAYGQASMDHGAGQWGRLRDAHERQNRHRLKRLLPLVPAPRRPWRSPDAGEGRNHHQASRNRCPSAASAAAGQYIRQAHSSWPPSSQAHPPFWPPGLPACPPARAGLAGNPSIHRRRSPRWAIPSFPARHAGCPSVDP